MELILLYLLFAATTAVACTFSLYLPVVRSLQNLEDPPVAVQHSNGYLLLCVLFVCAMLAAPVMLPIYLVSDYSETFKDALFNNLQKEQ